jgi:prepilin-type N-terminal cleavage/methylation domain-containing protein
MESKGFSLIEILIALVILSIALLGLAGLMIQTTKNNSFGGRMTEAATFAQDKLEEFRAIGWVKIPPNTGGIDQLNGATTGIVYTRNWQVAPNPINGNLKEITVTINWADQTNHSIRLFSILSP